SIRRRAIGVASHSRVYEAIDAGYIQGLLLVGRGVGSEIASPERLHSLSPSLCWLGSVSIPESLGTGLLMLPSPSGAIVEQGNDLRVLVVLEAGDRRDHARDKLLC